MYNPKIRVKATAAAIAAVAVLGLTACNSNETTNKSAHKTEYAQAEANRGVFKPFIPKHAVEFNNYNKSQELYDNPSTIIWCSTTWGNASAPIVTVPVTGKLTSSTVSFFPNKVEKSFEDYGSYFPELTSVDGMYHGTPPPYRYGFTPGGQYVDFFNMPTLCTTSLNSFQRSATKVTVSIDKAVQQAQRKAENVLAAGQQTQSDGSTKTAPAAQAEAQRLLEGAVG